MSKSVDPDDSALPPRDGRDLFLDHAARSTTAIDTGLFRFPDFEVYRAASWAVRDTLDRVSPGGDR